MLLSPTVQHRAKHFELLLLRELASIEREHEQHLTRHKNLEQSIRRDSVRLAYENCIRLSEEFDMAHQEPGERSNDKNGIQSKSKTNQLFEKSSLSKSPGAVNYGQASEATISPLTVARNYKVQRFLPSLKKKSPNRRNYLSKDLPWIAHFRQINRSNKNPRDIFSELNCNLENEALPQLTPLEKQMYLFMESLPKYTGIQRGFDNFGASSLYSNRPPFVMK